MNPRTCVILKLVFCWEILSCLLLFTPFCHCPASILQRFHSGMCYSRTCEKHILQLPPAFQFPAMTDIEDDISELSSLSSYPSSSGIFSQNRRDETADIFDFGLDENNQSVDRVPQSPSHSPILTPVPRRKRKGLASRSWVWGKAEEPLGLLVEIDGIK